MPKSPTQNAEAELRTHGLAYPETSEDFPWGHRALKVRGKAFAFLVNDGDGLSVSVKLPHTSMAALLLPYVEPTGYGMGKHDWITAQFPPRKAVPLPMVKARLDESYRAVAPKRLVTSLDKPAAGPAAPPAARVSRPASAKTRTAPKPRSRSTATRAPQRRSRTSAR